MKKIAMLMIALMILIASMTVANAEQAPWYELSSNNTVLTVRLNGENWNWEISDPAALELITQDTTEGLIASFMSTAFTESEVSLILRRAQNEAVAATETKVLGLNINASNVITVASELTAAPTAEWFEMDEAANVLTVRLPGENWNFEVVEPKVAELITMETNNGAFVASFMPTMTEFGMSQLVFTAENGLETRTIDIFVIESGEMTARRAEVFEIPGTTQTTQTAEAFPFIEVVEAEPQPVEFKTVTVSGGTVNLRAAATTESESIAKLGKGEIVRYLGRTVADQNGMEWHNIAYGEVTGWMSAKYAKLGGEGYVRIVNGNCNMRTKPSLNSEVITVLKKDSTIKYLGQGLTDTTGATWYKISNNNKEGWVSSQYAVFTTPPAPAKKETKKTEKKSEKKADKTEYKYVKISGGDTNLRKKANVDAKRITTLKKGTTVTYLGKQSTDERGVVWYKVSHNDKTGWVSSKYAKLTNTSGKKNKEKKEESSDMRLVYNPNRYKYLQVHDMYSQDGRTIYVVGNFGTVNSSGEPSKFDSRKNVTMKLVAGAEVWLPASPSSDDNIRETSDPYIWFNNAAKASGGSYCFYATFSMNEAGELRSLVYEPMY